MNSLLKELYEARKDYYHKMCIIESIVEKTGIEKNQLKQIECFVKNAEADYLEASDRYHDELQYKASKERSLHYE